LSPASERGGKQQNDKQAGGNQTRFELHGVTLPGIPRTSCRIPQAAGCFRSVQ
jgi:hypothetical protein